MAATNRDRVGHALEVLKRGLVPYITREMDKAIGKTWVQTTLDELSIKEGRAVKPPIPWDSQLVVKMMLDNWQGVFQRQLGASERTLLNELRDVRNRWAHEKPFSTDDTYRALDTVERLLLAVSAEEAREIDPQKQELLRLKFEEQVRHERRKAAVPTEGQPQSGLQPWREVVTPHPDVSGGRYIQAEFAADLWQVYLGGGGDEYRDPVEFYRRTFLTHGLRELLTDAIRRLHGLGGQPVIKLQTNFGGGKTHSMLALYHLVSGAPIGKLAGVEDILREKDDLASVTSMPKVRRAVLVGNKISPATAHTKPDGTVVRTWWGELAWQLGGKEGFAMVAEADQKGKNPGDVLRLLFNRFAPCLILIDEWVAYARQLSDDESLPAGTFATHFTFAQTLSEAAKTAERCLLVVSIPQSRDEIGGSLGQEAVRQLENAVGRVDKPWRPADADESFEIVRRRLFQPLSDRQFLERNKVVRAFKEMYQGQDKEFPRECRESDYARRMELAYPIHPELFDRLYSDWSSLDRFQRTRGVLRLMASVIHTLWVRGDSSLVIMPGTVPIDEADVSTELTRNLDPSWRPVVEQDVDGASALPLAIDREAPNLGRYSACRRVARTVFLGSAPTLNSAIRGIDDRHIKLGCTQPGENAPIFGDALRRLTDRARFLYADGARYWYSTQASVTRLAEQRAADYSDDDIFEEIKRRLRTEETSRGDFVKVHPAPAASSDVPDEPEARLVILGPEFHHVAKAEDSPARVNAQAMLESRGTSPRSYRNSLVFLAADGRQLDSLGQAVRAFLSWKSIDAEQKILNLDEFQRSQAASKLKDSEETIRSRIRETYVFLLQPVQRDPQGKPGWEETRVTSPDPLPVRVSKKLKNGGLSSQLGWQALKLELDRVPLWRGNHVALRQLAEDFARYLYLPRLTDPESLIVVAAAAGVNNLSWDPDGAAFAKSWDEERKRYVDLAVSQGARVTIDGLLVKPEIAAAQFVSEKPEPKPTGGTTVGAGAGPSPTVPTQPIPPSVAKEKRLHRFHGTAEIGALRLGKDAGKIAEEVVSRLGDAEVEITLMIQAKNPDGFSDQTIRTIRENCKQLKFMSFEFEEE
ncbi:MAG: DUF499 domain-containing protein [Thermoanaerobaculia bacterium]|nr:DUF499 domain-containing protein [Thermoanaerobaculia bacterium]